MFAVAHPALEKFAAQIERELVLAQVVIFRTENGFELRHVADRDLAAEKLRLVALSELRALAQSTASGAFRPLKSAPNLANGWRAVASDTAELEIALHQLYPGAITDWFAAQSAEPPVTHYREFTNRQTGMYRLTQMLSDEQAAQMIRAGCHRQFCLKRRLWTVPGLAADAAVEKSLIPCLEPCAVLLEFARKAMRIEQADKVHLAVSVEDAATLEAALQNSLQQPDFKVREGDFGAADNLRRVQLVLEKLQPLLKPASSDK